MTEEEKVKAYDEALKRAKKLQKTCDSQAVVGWCKYIFIELKESEDEKIKKRIIQAIKIREKEMNEEWSDEIAWLEKQGQKSAWSEEDEEMYQNIHECLKNGWRKLPTDLLKYESWFESIKQRIR